MYTKNTHTYKYTAKDEKTSRKTKKGRKCGAMFTCVSLITKSFPSCNPYKTFGFSYVQCIRNLEVPCGVIDH